jgi:hypothetical protein
MRSPVGRDTTIVLVTMAVAVQVLNLWLIQKIRPHLTSSLWVALWTKKLIVVLTVLSGGAFISCDSVRDTAFHNFRCQLGCMGSRVLLVLGCRLALAGVTVDNRRDC